MTPDRHKYQILQLVTPIISIVSLIIMAIVWINTMSGIPPRVTKAEERIAELEKSQTALDVKMEMTLKAVYEIRSVIMGSKLKNGL